MTSFTDWVEEPPADGTWTNYATLRDPHFFVDLVRTNIRLFRDETPHDTAMRLNFDLEPAPYLDYHLFNVLVSFPERAIGSHIRKPMEDVIHARKDYFRSHEEYRIAFCRLQDAWAYGVILEQDKMQLVNSGTANAEQLENHETALQKNDVELAQVYDIAVEKREMKRRFTTTFSQAKESFLKNELSLLVFLGKHLYKRHLEILNSQDSLQSERQSSPPAQEPAPSDNSNVVPLGSQETENGNVAVMNQHAQRVRPRTLPSGSQLMELGPSPVMHRHSEPMHENTIHYPSFAGQPFGTCQPVQQALVEQETYSCANKLLSFSPAPAHPMQLAPMHQRSTLSPQQTAALQAYQPYRTTKQQMLKFLNYRPPGPNPATTIAPLQSNIPWYSNEIYAEPPNNKLPSHTDPSFSPFSATSSMQTPQLAETAPWALAPMQEDREYAPKRSEVFATPHVPMAPKQQPTRPRHSTAASPTISYSRVPVQQKVKTPKLVAPAGGFLSRLLETEMTEGELDEVAARLGPGRRRVVEEEASDEMLCDGDA